MVMLEDAESRLQNMEVVDMTHCQPCLVCGFSPGLNWFRNLVEWYWY
jgi:hypothetical protein